MKSLKGRRRPLTEAERADLKSKLRPGAYANELRDWYYTTKDPDAFWPLQEGEKGDTLLSGFQRAIPIAKLEGKVEVHAHKRGATDGVIAIRKE